MSRCASEGASVEGGVGEEEQTNHVATDLLAKARGLRGCEGSISKSGLKGTEAF